MLVTASSKLSLCVCVYNSYLFCCIVGIISYICLLTWPVGVQVPGQPRHHHCHYSQSRSPPTPRGTYNYYDPELRAKIGKYAATFGNKAAVNKFKLRLAGGIVNRAIVIAAANGIVEYHNPALLHTHGGPVVLGKKWADSLLGRMGLVKRKATKAARKIPDDFADVKLAFLQRVASTVKETNIPFELIINWDQTGSKFVPASQWTLADEGAKQVDVVGVEDKREMTVLLAITLAGQLLPPQLLSGATLQ